MLTAKLRHWRASLSLSSWLSQHGVPGISGVDTRYLTRKLRDQGTLKAALSTRGTPAENLLAIVRQWPGLDKRDMVTEVTRQGVTSWLGDAGSPWVSLHPENNVHIVVLDYGVKRNILRHLASYTKLVTVVPAYTRYDELQALEPDAVLLSNGPGDPAGLPGMVEVVRQLIDAGEVPIFGICLGHQLIGRALGGETRRLKFGHHSANHPVQDSRTRKVLITAQNHNYAVIPESLNPDLVEMTFLSLNDHTLEGMRLRHRPVFSVQFHPEAAPGPHDAHGLFDLFFAMIEEVREKR